MKLIVGISGASGAPYAARLLQYLAEHRERLDVEAHVIFTKNGRLCWSHEVGVDPESLGWPIYRPTEMTAPFASGSSLFDAMVVLPCSAGQVGRIAHGISSDLIGRAADVMLKERRPLVLLLRESPYSLVHCRNMVAVTEAGAIIQPASPGFYSKPSDLNQLIDVVVCKTLDLLGIDNSLMTRWTGEELRG